MKLIFIHTNTACLP